MRVLALLWVVSVAPVMAQIMPIKEYAPPPTSSAPMTVQLYGVDGKISVPGEMLATLAQSEPEIAAPEGAPREGTVIVWLNVSPTGVVVNAFPVRRDEVLGQAAAAGVMATWKYRPLLVNGEAQLFRSSVVIQFHDGVGTRKIAMVSGMAYTPQPQVQPGRVRVAGGVLAGLMLHSVAPIYPPIARESHVQGVVILHAVISKSGGVENLQAISGPPMLVGAAKDAVQQWTYRPYLLNGEPVEVETTINVNFKIADPPKPDPLDSQ